SGRDADYRGNSIRLENAADDFGFHLGLEALRKVQGLHVEIVRRVDDGIGFRLLIAAFGILRHASRISQNVEGARQYGSQRRSDACRITNRTRWKAHKRARTGWRGSSPAPLSAP